MLIFKISIDFSKKIDEIFENSRNRFECCNVNSSYVFPSMQQWRTLARSFSVEYFYQISMWSGAVSAYHGGDGDRETLACYQATITKTQ